MVYTSLCNSPCRNSRTLSYFRIAFHDRSSLVLQDRRDLVSAHGGLGQLGSSICTTSSTSSFTSAPRLSHTPTTDFQPPYFPPPYNLPPQQPVDFHHPHVNADPYSHLNSFQGPQQHYHQLHPPERPLKYPRDDPLNMHPGLPGAYDSRRSDYGAVRRPDVLMHSGHGLDQDTSILSLHGSTGVSMENGTQVSVVLLLVNRTSLFLYAYCRT